MNCKPGDLAIIVRSKHHENLGRLVRVLSYLPRAAFNDAGILRDCWLIEGRFANVCPASRLLGADGCIPDECLRPIRDPGDDAKDEMLRPLPHEAAA